LTALFEENPMHSIELRSDNAAGVAPEILQAIEAANSGSALAYGGDEWSTRLQALVAEVFEQPAVTVFPVLTGTAANAIALSAMCPPWGAVLCHETAHILRSEGGATSMFGAGAVMRGLPGENYLLEETSLEAAFATTRWGDPHHSQPAVVSLTNPTDLGTVYPLARIAALSRRAHEQGLLVHMDGARLANALVSLGCSPAALTWQAGVDVVTLGATKNGVMTADAIVCFNAEVAKTLTFRLKRAGQVASKMRFQAVQLQAYLSQGRWLSWASQANNAMQALVLGLKAQGASFVVTPVANMAFVHVDKPMADRLQAAGLLFYRTAPGVIRLVTSFQTTSVEIEETLVRWQQCL
jgi:threonine aldolase